MKKNRTHISVYKRRRKVLWNNNKKNNNSNDDDEFEKISDKEEFLYSWFLNTEQCFVHILFLLLLLFLPFLSNNKHINLNLLFTVMPNYSGRC